MNHHFSWQNVHRVLFWIVMVTVVVGFVGASPTAYAGIWHGTSGQAWVWESDGDLEAEDWREETYSPNTTVSVGLDEEGFGMAEATFAVDLANGTLGTQASATNGYQSYSRYQAGAQARFWDTMTVMFPAGYYAYGANMQLGVAVDGQLLINGHGAAGQAWHFSLAGSGPVYGYDRFDGIAELRGDGTWAPGGGVPLSYNVSEILNVPLIGPGTTLYDAQGVLVRIYAEFSSYGETSAWGDEGSADFLSTGRFTSLTLPSAEWSLTSGSQWYMSPGFELTIEPADVAAVPVPGAILLGVLGLGYAGRRLRREHM